MYATRWVAVRFDGWFFIMCTSRSMLRQKLMDSHWCRASNIHSSPAVRIGVGKLDVCQVNVSVWDKYYDANMYNTDRWSIALLYCVGFLSWWQYSMLMSYSTCYGRPDSLVLERANKLVYSTLPDQILFSYSKQTGLWHPAWSDIVLLQQTNWSIAPCLIRYCSPTANKLVYGTLPDQISFSYSKQTGL